MSAFWQDIFYHLMLLAIASMVIGHDLRRSNILGEEKDFQLLIPFWNLGIWFKHIQLPGWFVLVFLQAYWLPIWWINVLSVLVFAIACMRTWNLYQKVKRPYIILASAVLVFTVLFSFWMSEHRLWLVISLAIGSGCLLRIPKDSFKAQNDNSFSFSRHAAAQFRKNKVARFAYYVLIGLTFIAMYSDYLANSRPIYAEVDGKSYYPAYESLLDPQYSIKLADEEQMPVDFNWHSNAENIVWSLIPYSPNYQDRYNRNFKGPSDEQLFKNKAGSLVPISPHFKHHLGTDKTGRDVASGLIHATKISLSVGFISMGIATLLGIFLGAISGYFGNFSVKAHLGTFVMVIIGLFLAYFYAFIALDGKLSNSLDNGNSAVPWYLLKFILVFGLPLLFWYLSRFVNKIPFLKRRMPVRIDAYVMRGIEILNSIPRLLLILVLAATFEEKSLFLVMMIIGLTSWTGIARFTRAEILRVRELEYIESAKALGFSDWRIIVKHILPNALAPVFVSVSFGIAAAILIESSLSFLNIGVPDDVVTWGSMLSTAKDNWEASWMVVFPGLAIFITVTVYNLIGEGLRDALDPKLKK